MSQPDIIKGETCPVCAKKTLTLTEQEDTIPFFGKIAIFGMKCDSCDFNKSDVESIEQRDPIKTTVEVSGEKDMNIRIVKSSEATLKVPYIADIKPGEASNGYVTNVEGVLQKIKEQVEQVRDSEDDKAAVKKAKNIIKKINRIMWGDEKGKIIIEDPTGNSAILHDKALVEKLKVKK